MSRRVISCGSAIGVVSVPLLGLIGCALLRISLLSDLYLRYVKEGLRPLLIASGGVVLGLVAALRTREHSGQEERGHEEGQGDDVGHGHSHPAAGPKTAWVLALKRH